MRVIASDANTDQQGLGWEYQIAAADAGWRFQFYFTIRIFRFRMAELFTLAAMNLNRPALIFVTVTLAAGVLVSPLVVRGILRYYALHNFLRLPGARERVAVEPKKRTLTALPSVHPVNLGYAAFDTGSTSPISIEAVASGASVLLTYDDVRIQFLPPYGPEMSTNLIPASARVSAHEARTHPHTLTYLHEMEADQMAAEMTVEETQMLRLSKILFMSSDDFLLYSMRLSLKASLRWGSIEVQFFESPDAKGIVRTGDSTKDRPFAAVFLASPDGARKVGLQMDVIGSSLNAISVSLDPILRSFRFTTDAVGDRDRIKALIREAGIQQKADSQDGAANGSQPFRQE